MYTFQQAADAARICMQEIVERGNAHILADAVTIYPGSKCQFYEKIPKHDIILP